VGCVLGGGCLDGVIKRKGWSVVWDGMGVGCVWVLAMGVFG
jgi:hypothetical protein